MRVPRQAMIGGVFLVGICVACSFALARADAAASLPADLSNPRFRLAGTGTLAFERELVVKYPPTACPAGTPNAVECFARTGSGIIRGLGSVKVSYPYFVENNSAGCAADEVRVLPATVRLTVAGKGEIEVRVGGSDCLQRVPPNPVRGEERFTVTGGSGRYAGASGGGTISHVSNGPPNWDGRDTWIGTILVPGLEFDLTPPMLRGAAVSTRAPRGKKSARVVYKVAARDHVDGIVPAICRPPSGTLFRVGRTIVRCTASDKSGNTANATFTVTVRAPR
jgi:HYR domain